MHGVDPGTGGGAGGHSEVPVAVGGFEIGVGEDDGMSIRDSGAPTLTAARNEKALNNALKRDNEPKARRGPLDDVEDAAADADNATTQIERAEAFALQVAQDSFSVSVINNELDSLFALLQRLDAQKRFDKELRLARALSKLLAVAERWLELVRTLEHALAAARATKDRAAEAWASHELGTLRLAVGQLRAADALLTEALATREALGDRRGAAATSRNLTVLCRALRFKLQRRQLLEAKRLLRIFRALPLVLLVTVLLGGMAAVAFAIAASPGSVPVISSISPTSGPPEGGTRVTIHGTHLTRNSIVLFGRERAIVIGTVGDPSLIVIAPPGHGTVPVRVRTDGHLSALARAPLFKYAEAHKPPPGRITVGALANPGAGGSVSANSSSQGASCSGSSCTLESGGEVTLTAAANAGFGFSSWSGACAGQSSSTCTLSDVTQDSSAIAGFARLGEEKSSITISGSANPSAGGSVSVSSSSQGASCSGSSCTLESGGDVTLTARPSHGFAFGRWTGVCAGESSSTCTLSDVTKDSSAIAGFARTGQHGTRITVGGSANPSAGGAVSANSSSQGASCSGSTCTVQSGGEVMLTAAANAGFGFSGWSGDCAAQTSSSCTLDDVSRDEHATATFVATFTVGGSANPSTGGSVSASSSSQGSSCSGSSCTVQSGGDVTFTAAADAGFGFSGWSGDCAGQTGSTCTLNDVSSSENATAAFVPAFTVAWSANPSTGGTVGANSSSQGASCSGSSCTVQGGGEVTLTAAANAGFGFSGWSGACAGQKGSTCTLDDVTSDENATARFETVSSAG
jgi:tetratricopeptide (TPR) repeat protein